MFYSLKLNAAYLAGNITYKWISGYTYQIKYTTYTTIYSGTDPYCQLDSVYFGDGTHGSLLRSNGLCGGPCSPACEGVVLSSTIRWNEYVTTHNYPGRGNYRLWFEAPNRSSGVINIPNSVNQTMSFESKLIIPTFGNNKNTSPEFANHPVESGCLNNGCFTHYPLATDMIDSDSLSYEIAMCKGSLGAITPGFSYPNAGAGGTFSINPVTGLLSWCNPQFAGDYSVIIKITEWRKNDDGTPFIVGYVERDTHLSIGTCTGINELNETESIIQISPNPVIENLNISFNKEIDELLSLELFDVTGSKIKTFDSKELISKHNQFVLNLENIQPGIYFLKFIGSNNTSITKKIIKQ